MASSVGYLPTTVGHVSNNLGINRRSGGNNSHFGWLHCEAKRFPQFSGCSWNLWPMWCWLYDQWWDPCFFIPCVYGCIGRKKKTFPYGLFGKQCWGLEGSQGSPQYRDRCWCWYLILILMLMLMFILIVILMLLLICLKRYEWIDTVAWSILCPSPFDWVEHVEPPSVAQEEVVHGIVNVLPAKVIGLQKPPLHPRSEMGNGWKWSRWKSQCRSQTIKLHPELSIIMCIYSYIYLSLSMLVCYWRVRLDVKPLCFDCRLWYSTIFGPCAVFFWGDQSWLL